MKLALGTVQFGVDYGIANRTGKVAAQEIDAILSTASAAGIRTIDTAIAYGDSEARLGLAGVSQFEVVSKLPAGVTADVVDELVAASVARLGVSRLDGLLLHRSADLIGVQGRALHDALLALKQSNLVGKIGISIYDPAELEPLFDSFAIDLVQAPYNLIDRRLETSGWLGRLKRAGIEVHTRSAFLQGLLLMPASARPAAFQRWRELFERWDAWLTTTGLTALGAALGFAVGNSNIDRVLVGVDSNSQLVEILSALAADLPASPPDLASEDPALINPSYWNKT